MLNILGLFMLALVSCGPVTAVPTGTPTITLTPSRTPTATRPPTNTPAPTRTKTPTPTPYPLLSQVTTLGQGIMPQIIYSPDGQRAFLSDGYKVRVLKTSDDSEITSFKISEDGYGSIGPLSPDGKSVIKNNFVGFSIIEIETQKEIGKGSGGNGNTSGKVFSPDSKYVIYKANDRTTGGPYHSICRVEIGKPQDTATEYGDCYPTIENRRYTVMTNPAVSPDGRLVAAGYRERTKNILFIWDLEQKTILHQIEELPSELNSVAFSPDGSTLATAGDDGLIRLWNPVTGKIKRSITAFTNGISYIRFSADGRSLIVDVYEQPTVTYGLDTGKITPLAPPTPDALTQKLLGEGYLLSGNRSNVRFSPDGKTLAVGHGSLQVWDVSSKTLKASLFGNGAIQIAGMTYSPDGNHLAVVTLQGDVYAWDLRSGQREFFVSSNTLAATQVFDARAGISARAYGMGGIALSPDSSQIALTNGLAVEVWNIQTNSKTLSLALTNPLMSPTEISYSADGKYIYADLNRNFGIAVWDAASGALLRQMNLPRDDSNTFSATDLKGPLFAADNHDDKDYWIEIWNIDNGQMTKIPTHLRETGPLRFSADGKFLSTMLNQEQIYIWHVETGQLVFFSKLVPSEFVFDAGDFSISPDGSLLASANSGKVILYNLGQYTRAAFQPGFVSPPMPPTPTPWGGFEDSIYPTLTPQPTQMVTPPPAPSLPAGAINPANAAKLKLTASLGRGVVSRLSWSKNGIFVTSSRGAYRLDPQNLQEISAFQPDLLAVTSSQVLADGRTLVGGITPGGKIQVWDAGSASLLFEHAGQGQPAISPDGKWLVFDEPGNGLATWSLESAQKVASLRSYNSPAAPVFSPNGRFVAAIQYDRSIRVWDAQIGVIINGVGGSEGRITEMSFSPDGNYLLGAAGGTAWVWSMAPSLSPFKIELYQGEENGNLTLFKHTVTAIAANADVSLVAVGSSERKIQLYNRKTGQQTGTLTDLTGVPVKMQFSPDGASLLALDADGRMSLWNIASQKLVLADHQFSGPITGLVSRLDGNFSAWMQNAIWTFTPAGERMQSTYIPTDKVLAASPAGDLAIGYTPWQASLYDAKTGQLIRTLPEEAEDVYVEYYWEGDIIRQFYGALFSPDGKRFTTFGTGGAWMYTADGNLVSHLEGNNTRKAAFSFDGDLLVASPFENINSLALFDFKTAERIFDLEVPTKNMEGSRSPEYIQYAYSPDKRWIGVLRHSWSDPSRLGIVDTSTGLVAKFLDFEDASPLSLVFDPASNLIAVGKSDGTIALVNLATMEVITTLQAQVGPVTSLAFSADGLHLISAGPDGVIHIWGLP